MKHYRFDRPGQTVDLGRLPTRPPKNFRREDAEKALAPLGEELFSLQELLWGARTHAVLLVLQGRDTAGKDGVIKNVVGYLNPRGVSVTSFGVPTEEEREHDFLWRVRPHAPRHGTFSIFNRSHYEDVLVVRVHDLVPKEVWSRRYEQIDAFEQTLAAHRTIVLKFYLHISAEEQQERLLEREADPKAAWKLSVGDWREREHWKAYTRAYEEALSRCASPEAPWLVVPADKKWYRNWVVADALCAALRPYRKEWQARLDTQGAQRHAELEAYRTASRSGRSPKPGDKAPRRGKGGSAKP